MNPQVRTGLTHVGTALGGVMAGIAFVSTKGVDLYAIWDQLNVVIADITKLLAIATPVATAAYGVYKASTKEKLKDVIADPKAVEVAATMPATPAAIAVAEALKSNGR